MIEKAMRAGMDKNIGHEYNKDVESRYRQDYRPTIPTPWPVLNDGIQGGWGPGDLIIMFGNPGGGKIMDYGCSSSTCCPTRIQCKLLYFRIRRRLCRETI